MCTMDEQDLCSTVLCEPEQIKDNLVCSEAQESFMISDVCHLAQEEPVETLEIEEVNIALPDSKTEEREFPLLENPVESTYIVVQSNNYPKLELNEYISEEVFDTANEVEIDTSEEKDTDQASLNEYGYNTLEPEHKDDVPDTVAAETVVTTSQPRRRKQELKCQNILVEPDIEEAELGVGSSTESTGWILHSDNLYLEQPTSSTSVSMDTQHVVEVLTSGESNSYVAVAPDSTSADITGGISSLNLPTISMSTVDLNTLSGVDKSNFEASVRALTKRQRDRLKKRELRMNNEFRMLEKVKSRERMRLKREDPEYREQERERDRIRRWNARRSDAVRKKERERDKSYKRIHRKLPKDQGSLDDT